MTFDIPQVRFESGPVGGQDVEIRVSNDPVTSSQAANTLLTGAASEVCGGAGNTIDGLTTMDVCCSRKGRYVTLQATGTDNVPLGGFNFRFYSWQSSWQCRTKAQSPVIYYLHICSVSMVLGMFVHQETLRQCSFYYC